MMSIFSRLHPLLVHLPIGILLAAFVMLLIGRRKKDASLTPAIHFMTGLGVISAALSAASGWLLSDSGDYQEALVQKHQYWGLGATALFLSIWINRSEKLGWWLLGVTALVVTGHFGGSLTHGSDYLWKAEATVGNSVTALPSLSPETQVYEALIQPILRQKCGNCHQPEKKKGGLVLTTPEGLFLGGENGRVVVPGAPDSSSLINRVLLPLHHDDHMPPAGKAQLSELELALLQWWISGGADIQVKLAALPLPEALQSKLLSNQGSSENPVFQQKVDPAPANIIQALKQKGVSVSLLAENQPWLKVSFAGHPDVSVEVWNTLGKIKSQVIELDVSHSNLGDDQLRKTTFPHLVRLNLAHTQVQMAITEFIRQSPWLEVLNISNTAVDQRVVEVFKDLKQLQRVYVWQSPLSTLDLSAQFPAIQFVKGAVISDSLTMELTAPKLKYGRSFFDDTAHVELEFPFKGVDIYYTLDEAASPTTQSPKYNGTIVLDKTAHVRAFAAKSGWNPSALVEAVFVKKKYQIKSATLQKSPSPKYPAKGAPSLVDGKIADAQGADTWLGYEGEHMTATLDLGELRTIGSAFVHCLENNNSWIHKPVGIQVFTSEDGKKFNKQGSVSFAPNRSMGEQKVHLLGCHFVRPVTTRFVQVKVENMLKNPDWHPGKGLKSWIFIDEIVVE